MIVSFKLCAISDLYYLKLNLSLPVSEAGLSQDPPPIPLQHTSPNLRQPTTTTSWNLYHDSLGWTLPWFGGCGLSKSDSFWVQATALMLYSCWNTHIHKHMVFPKKSEFNLNWNQKFLLIFMWQALPKHTSFFPLFSTFNFSDRYYFLTALIVHNWLLETLIIHLYPNRKEKQWTRACPLPLGILTVRCLHNLCSHHIGIPTAR